MKIRLVKLGIVCYSYVDLKIVKYCMLFVY